MSKIKRLIAERCPDGVELVETGRVVQRAPNIRWDEREAERFQYIDLASVDRVTNRVGRTSTIDRESAPSRAQQEVRAGDVLFGTTRPMLKRYCLIGDDYDGQVASTGFCVLRPNERITSQWLYHLLGTAYFYDYVESNQRGSNYPAISDALVKKFKIPVPPLEVQREIVTILDRMEGRKAGLEAELEAELECRSRQYAYYRDSLLASAEREGVEWRLMSEVGEFFRGRRFTKDDVVPEGIPSIHYGEIYTRYGVFAREALSHVRPEMASSLRFAKTGDVVIAAVGETVEDVGKAVAWLGDEDIAIHDDCFAFRHTLDPKFVAYYFQTDTFHSELARHVSRAKVKRISGESLGKLSIPVPPRKEQERVVMILDKFQSLVNDLAVSLPAEIAVRRQQYEYYRDRLLTFKEAA